MKLILVAFFAIIAVVTASDKLVSEPYYFKPNCPAVACKADEVLFKPRHVNACHRCYPINRNYFLADRDEIGTVFKIIVENAKKKSPKIPNNTNPKKDSLTRGARQSKNSRSSKKVVTLPRGKKDYLPKHVAKPKNSKSSKKEVRNLDQQKKDYLPRNKLVTLPKGKKDYLPKHVAKPKKGKKSSKKSDKKKPRTTYAIFKKDPATFFKKKTEDLAGKQKYKDFKKNPAKYFKNATKQLFEEVKANYLPKVVKQLKADKKIHTLVKGMFKVFEGMLLEKLAKSELDKQFPSSTMKAK